MRNVLLKLTAFIILISFFKDTLAADTASGSSVLPYETWLKTIQKSLTGPVAFSVSLIGIVSCGATLIFTGGEMGRFMRSIVYLVMVMTLLVGANTLMSSLFNGATFEPYKAPYKTFQSADLSMSSDKADKSLSDRQITSNDQLISYEETFTRALSSVNRQVKMSENLIDNPKSGRNSHNTNSFNDVKTAFEDSFSFSFYKNEDLKAAC